MIGKEGDMYYAIKCNGLNRDQERRFKAELKVFVKGFCVEEIKEFTDQDVKRPPHNWPHSPRAEQF